MMLSRTYRPSAALEPYIRRFYVFEAALPDDFLLQDALLSETAFVRILLRGDWSAETSPGNWATAGQTVFFGANSRSLPVRVKGGFAVTGFAIRPSGWHALIRESHKLYLDQMFPLQQLWGDLASDMFAGVAAALDDAGQVLAMESAILERVNQLKNPEPDSAIAQFEIFARTDSTMRIEDASSAIGLSIRQFERRCEASFGMTPKAVLRRSRFLDTAGTLRGFCSPSEQELDALHYFDQSHMNREFNRFIGLTPRRFSDAQTPLLTAGLKLREESRFED